MTAVVVGAILIGLEGLLWIFFVFCLCYHKRNITTKLKERALYSGLNLIDEVASDHRFADARTADDAE